VIGKLLRSTFVALIVAPMALVIIHVLAFWLEWFQYGIHLTLYNGTSLTIYTIVTWLLFMAPPAFKFHNFVSIVVAWLFAWYIAADWVKDRRVDLVSPFLTVGVLLLYLAAWRHTSILLYFPESFTLFFTAWVMGVILSVRDKFRKKKTFFELLEERGFKLKAEEKFGVQIPIKCKHCGAVIHSYPKYCWNCGREL